MASKDGRIGLRETASAIQETFGMDAQDFANFRVQSHRPNVIQSQPDK